MEEIKDINSIIEKINRSNPNMYKRTDYISEEELERQYNENDVCPLCYIDEEFYEKIPKGIINCPHCNHSNKISEILSYMDSEDMCIVHEDNCCNEDEFLTYIPVVNCTECYGAIGFKPIPILYNGNHDVYYTGGKSYISNPAFKYEIDLNNSNIKKLVKSYTERIKSGEKGLTEDNLMAWISYEIEPIIAKAIYDVDTIKNK